MKVELRDLQVRFGALTALGGVSLSLEPGRVTVLLGPNGAGKTTLMGVLLGLVRPDGGAAVVDGVESAGLSRRHRAHLGYLPEAVAFADNLTGLQVARFFASARGLSGDHAGRALARTGLSAAAGRAVRGYSRGMRQRLGLAIAILGEPALLVLDEPTGGLDQEGLSLLWEILAEWRAAGRTVLVSTHDLALIERRADHLVVLRDGVVRASGSPEALRRQVGLPVRISVELADAAACAALRRTLEEPPAGQIVVQENRLTISVTPNLLHEALHRVERHHDQILQLRVEEPGFDDVYQRLIEVA